MQSDPYGDPLISLQLRGVSYHQRDPTPERLAAKPAFLQERGWSIPWPWELGQRQIRAKALGSTMESGRGIFIIQGRFILPLKALKTKAI